MTFLCIAIFVVPKKGLGFNSEPSKQNEMTQYFDKYYQERHSNIV